MVVIMKAVHAIRTPSLVSVIALTALLAGCGGGGDGGSTSSVPLPREEPYPVAVDDFDRNGDINRDAAHATPIVLSRSYGANIFPQGDLDWLKVDLVAGTMYEVVVDHQCATCGTETRLFGLDGVTEVGERNNYYQSTNRIKFTPAASGSYFIKVGYQTLDNRQDWGVSTYWVNVHPFVDSDADTISAWFDCNDQRNDISIWGNDIPGDGIDQDCTGADMLLASAPDRFETGDNSAATTTSTLPMATYKPEQMLSILRRFPEDRFVHTFTTGDADWYRVTVPAGHSYVVSTLLADGYWDYRVYQADGVTAASLHNTGSTDQTVFVKIFPDVSVGAQYGAHLYLPFLIDYGTDNDGDGYYSRDQDLARDCDDSNATIHPNATEIPGNGINEDCKYATGD
jgi:hypothetical protein